MNNSEGQVHFPLLIGYQTHDKVKGALGVIEDVLELPMQYLAKVNYNKKEVLIPLNDETIERIEKKTKTIYFNLPEGLLDI